MLKEPAVISCSVCVLRSGALMAHCIHFLVKVPERGNPHISMGNSGIQRVLSCYI